MRRPQPAAPFRDLRWNVAWKGSSGTHSTCILSVGFKSTARGKSMATRKGTKKKSAISRRKPQGVRKTTPEIRALGAAVETLQFVLAGLIKVEKQRGITVRVGGRKGSGSTASIVLECSGETDAEKAKCERFGEKLQKTGNYACSSTEDGVECEYLVVLA